MSFFISTLQSTIYSNIKIKKYIMKVFIYMILYIDYCNSFQRYAEIFKWKTKTTAYAVVYYMGVLLQVLALASME